MSFSPAPPRNGTAGVFPSLTASFLLALGLVVAGGGWVLYLADGPVSPTLIDGPFDFSSGEIVVLGDPRHPTDLACGDQQVDTADLSLCKPGQPRHIRFTYIGRQLWLQLQRGDDFGLLFVTVDDRPANLIPIQAPFPAGNGERAGRLPLYSPYEHATMRPESEWISVHRTNTAQPHTVQIQMHSGPMADILDASPAVLAVGTDLPVSFRLPYWPGLLCLILGGLALMLVLLAIDNWPLACRFPMHLARRQMRRLSHVLPTQPIELGLLAGLGILAVGLGQRDHIWWLSLLGLAMLGLAGLQRPALWLGAVLLGLPFHLFPVPLAPGFALNLVEIGAWGGLALVGLQYLRQGPDRLPQAKRGSTPAPVLLALLALALVALGSALEAQYQAQGLREWRTVFLTAVIFLGAMVTTLRMSERPEADAAIMLIMWIGGAVAIALFGYYAYLQGIFVTDVDGVRRIRGLFGSPNNLALYLERTLLVTIALFLFAQTWPRRILWASLATIQTGAFVLTFSKGGLFLGLPTGLLLLFGTVYLLRQRLHAARRVMWLLGGVAILGLLLLAPFLTTPRLAGILDWRQDFSSFVRIHLWRSGLQMFLDNWILGVGPDNFLYWYRGAYLDPAVWNEPSLNHPHNILIDLLSRLGLTGLVAGLAFWGAGFRILLRHINTSNPSPLAMGLAAAGVAGLAHGMVDTSYALPDLMLVWTLLFGLVCLQDLTKTARLLT